MGPSGSVLLEIRISQECMCAWGGVCVEACMCMHVCVGGGGREACVSRHACVLRVCCV